MRDNRHLALLLAVVLLTACDMATPFRGSGYDADSGVTIGDEPRLIVVVTNAELGDDSALRSVFWDYVETVEASLDGRAGFVGCSERARLPGNEVWTMTVWTDEASLEAFVASDAHQAASREALPALSAARFARFEVDREDIPVPWARALAELESASARAARSAPVR